jgi:hypothetical protein
MNRRDGVAARLMSSSGIISILFRNSEPGVFYDPSDLTTMFQDTTGTTPVTTPGQTVALLLDKSKGLVLGSELVVNGNFDTDTTGWTTQSGWSISGGTANANTTTAANVSQLGILTVGKYYKISFTISNFTAGFGAILVITPNFVNVLGNGTYTVQGFANSTNFQVYAGPTSSFSVDNISVKELAGNHATQATAASRPTYGIVPLGGRRNLLTRTEEFGDAAWTKPNVALTENAAVAPNGTMTAESMIPNTTGSVVHGINERPADLATVIPAGAYTVSVYVKSNGYNWFRLRSFDGTSDKDVWFNLSTGQVGTTPAGATPSITSLGSGWYRCSIQLTASTNITLRYSSQFFASPADNTINFAGDGTSGILLWGAQIELGSTATAYQRVTTQYDVTEAGVQSLSYLFFDGVDDFLVTPTITPNIDKVQVFAGVRKLSDAAVGTLVELSATITSNNGAFSVPAPTASNDRYGFNSKGTILASSFAIGYAAPTTNVLAGLGDISGDTATLRINGNQVAQNTGDQGTGNYLAYPLYIGRRGGTSFPFNGQIYNMIVRFGANLTTTQITNTERYVNKKTGAY